ncbi:MAG: C39 family peptidase [Acidobacteria bacterium]|nr:C39 family peptidase [Acidobacteriota bacterium]
MMLLAASAAAVALTVPFVPQEKDTCGAAALAMVLRYWDTPVPHDEIAAALFEPELHAIRGSRLEAFAKERGLTAIAYEGDAAHLREFVARGRPLIVAWRMDRDRYHNVVVVGFDDGKDEILVNDPALGAARPVAGRTFEERWAGAGHWTLLVLPAQE